MRVELHPTTSPESYFRILPRYKVRSIGDLVRVNDEIVLESAESRGQFLDVSARSFGEPRPGEPENLIRQMIPGDFCIPSAHEVHSSVNKTSFVLSKYASTGEFEHREPALGSLEACISTRPAAKDARDGEVPVQAGDVIQLFHKDSDCYVAAEGVFTNPLAGAPKEPGTENYWLAQDVHLRNRKPDPERPSRLNPPTSAVSYFQVEKVNQEDGGVIDWEEPVRLRHLTSQMYLAIGQYVHELEGNTTLMVMDGTKRDTLFRLTPVIRGTAYVPSDGYTRIQHVDSEKWIHALISENSEVTRQDDFSTKQLAAGGNLEGIERAVNTTWDKAELRQLVLSDTQHFQDAFSARVVPDEHVYSVGFVAGIVPILRQYAQRRNVRELTPLESMTLAGVLNDLHGFMFDKGIEIKTRQKLLRDFKVIEILMEMAQAPFSEKCAEGTSVAALLKNGSDTAVDSFDDVVRVKHSNTMLVMNSVFRVLDACLKGNSRKMELYVSRHVPFLWCMFGTEMAVEPMLNELVRDNASIIQLCSEKEIQRVVTLLSQPGGKRADFLEFLSVLCVCNDTPVKEKQDVIGKHLLDRRDPPVFLTRVIPFENSGVQVSVSGDWDEDCRLLHDFAKTALDEKDETSTAEYLFLQRQLELYGNLCKGRHKVNIEFITEVHEHLTWEECFICVQSDFQESEPHPNTRPTSVMTCPPGADVPKDAADYADIIIKPKDKSRRRSSQIHDGIGHGDHSSYTAGAALDFPESNVIKSPKRWDQNFKSQSNDKPITEQKRLHRLPQSLRKLYVDLITNLFIDTPPQEGEIANRDVLSELDFNFEWGGLSYTHYTEAAQEQTQALSGARFEHFPVLKKWIFDVLEHTGAMVHNDELIGKPKNKLLKSVLNLLFTLIKYGYYADEVDIRHLMTPLQSVVNGTNDTQNAILDSKHRHKKSADHALDAKTAAEWVSKGRYVIDNDHNKVVVEAKYAALLCVDALFNFVFDVRLRFLVCDFKLTLLEGNELAALKDQSQKDKHRFGDASLLTDYERVQELEAHGHAALLREMMDKDFKVTAASTEAARRYLNDLKQKCDWIQPKWTFALGAAGVKDGDLSLVGVLLDLARYEEPRLLVKCLDLINRIYSGEQDLFNLAVQATVLTTHESFNLANHAELELPKLKQLGTGVISGDEDIGVFNHLLTFWTSKCYLKGQHSREDSIKFGSQSLFNPDGTYNDAWRTPGLNHHTNQNILYNAGILPIILDIIRVRNQPCSVLRTCFWFLRALCVGFPEVQVALYEAVDSLLMTSTKQTDPEDEALTEAWENSMGWCVAEIFNGCRETCLRIKPAQVEHMLKRVGGGSAEQTFKSSRLLEALCAVSKVEEWNLPLKRNQELIVKYLWAEKKQVVDIAAIDDESKEETNRERLALLAKGCTRKLAQQYHLNLVKLLASTCEGENRQIEAMCRSIFTLDELLQTIGTPPEEIAPETPIPHIHKGPYIAFLLWSYLNTGSTPVEVGTDKLAGRVDLFKSLNIIAEDEIAKKYFVAQTYISEGQAEFVYDIFIPTIFKLAKHHYPHSNDAQYHISSIAVNLATFLERAIVADEGRWDKFRVASTVQCLHILNSKLFPKDESGSSSSGPKMSSKDKQLLQKCFSEISQKGLTLDAGVVKNAELNMYETKYELELKRNSDFNNFVRALEGAYKSENTMAAQLLPTTTHGLSPEKFRGGGDAMYSDEVEGDIVLPLGPEFQHLVELFCSFNKSGVATFDKDRIAVIVRLFRDYFVVPSSSERERIQLTSVTIKTLQIVQAGVMNATIIAPEGTDAEIEVQDQIVDCGALLPVSFLMASASMEVQRTSLATLYLTINGGNLRAQKIFEVHFLDTREEVFFESTSHLVALATESIKELRILKRQKAEADKATELLRRTMVGSILHHKKQARQNMANIFAQDDDGPGQAKRGKEDPDHFVDKKDMVVVKEDGLSQETGSHGHFLLLLRVLQSMCEGNNHTVQNYLRTQPDNIKNFNIVTMVTNSLQLLAQEVSADTAGLVAQTLATLTEFCQGNSKNQRDAFDARVFDQVNILLRQTEFAPDVLSNQKSKTSAEMKADESAIVQLHYVAADLLDRMLETNDSQTAYLASQIDSSIEIPCILRHMRKYTMLASSGGFSGRKVSEFDLPIVIATQKLKSRDVGFLFFNVISRLQEFTKKRYVDDPYQLEIDTQWQKEQRENMAAAKKAKELKSLKSVYEDVTDETACIEVLVDNEIQRMFFRVKAKWKVSHDERYAVLWTVTRSAYGEQMSDFMKKSRRIIAEMKYLDYFKGDNSSFLTRWLLNGASTITWSFSVLAYVINIFMLIVWDAPPMYQQSAPVYRYSWAPTAMRVLGGINALLTVLVVIVFYISNPPTWRFQQSEVAAKDNVSSKEDTANGPGATAVAGRNSMDILRRLRAVDFVEIKNNLTYTPVLSSGSLVYVGLLIASALGNVFHGYTYAFHLLYVVLGNDILQRVMTSVTKNGQALGYVALLILILIYIYSLVAFAFMREYFNHEEGKFCDNMWQCFVTSVRTGLLSGGGLGEAMSEYGPRQMFGPAGIAGVAGIKSVFDVSFFVLVTLIGLNVVFGIIVDTFSELRAERNEVADTIENECFVCALKSADFDHYGNGWQQHVKKEHHMWDYLYFLRHLDEKSPSMYTYLEQHVAEMIFLEDYSFFPYKRALSLRKATSASAKANKASSSSSQAGAAFAPQGNGGGGDDDSEDLTGMFSMITDAIKKIQEDQEKMAKQLNSMVQSTQRAALIKRGLGKPKRAGGKKTFKSAAQAIMAAARFAKGTKADRAEKEAKRLKSKEGKAKAGGSGGKLGSIAEAPGSGRAGGGSGGIAKRFSFGGKTAETGQAALLAQNPAELIARAAVVGQATTITGSPPLSPTAGGQHFYPGGPSSPPSADAYVDPVPVPVDGDGASPDIREQDLYDEALNWNAGM